MTKRLIQTLEEWDEVQPILGRDIRDCAKCGEPTFWRTARQLKHGRCLDCQPHIPVAEDVYEAAAERAVDLILDAFPESDFGVPEPPDDVPFWHLMRMWWPVARRWDQQWVWVTPKQARDFNSFNRRNAK